MYQTPKSAGAVRKLQTNELRNTVMLRLRRVARMCSRTVSGTAYSFRHGSTLCSPTVEKILCRSPFRSGHISAICARLSQKEVGVKRVETLVSTLLPCRGARHTPAAGRGESPRSAERNSPLRFSEKGCRPDRVNRPRGSSTPLGRCRKGAARQGANTLTQFVCPAESVPRKKENPLTKVL